MSSSKIKPTNMVSLIFTLFDIYLPQEIWTVAGLFKAKAETKPKAKPDMKKNAFAELGPM